MAASSNFQGAKESDFLNTSLVSVNITMIKSVFTRFTLGIAGWLPSLEASKNN